MVKTVFEEFGSNFAELIKSSVSGLKGIFDWGK